MTKDSIPALTCNKKSIPACVNSTVDPGVSDKEGTNASGSNSMESL